MRIILVGLGFLMIIAALFSMRLPSGLVKNAIRP